jgi:hypothetical protein
MAGFVEFAGARFYFGLGELADRFLQELLVFGELQIHIDPGEERFPACGRQAHSVGFGRNDPARKSRFLVRNRRARNDDLVRRAS